jgi:hypothetical protein
MDDTCGGNKNRMGLVVSPRLSSPSRPRRLLRSHVQPTRARRLPRCRSRSRCCRRRALTQPRRQFLFPHQHRSNTSVRHPSPLESGSLKHSGLTLTRNAMVRSTIRQCTTHGRPFRWRCALSAWYVPARWPPTVSVFDSETMIESCNSN